MPALPRDVAPTWLRRVVGDAACPCPAAVRSDAVGRHGRAFEESERGIQQQPQDDGEHHGKDDRLGDMENREHDDQKHPGLKQETSLDRIDGDRRFRGRKVGSVAFGGRRIDIAKSSQVGDGHAD